MQPVGFVSLLFSQCSPPSGLCTVEYVYNALYSVNAKNICDLHDVRGAFQGHTFLLALAIVLPIEKKTRVTIKFRKFRIVLH